MDRIARRGWLRDAELTLTPKAMLLLDYLITHPDELISRERLLELLWGFDFPVGTRVVDNRVAELRRALGDDPTRQAWIATIPGQGYRFVPQVEESRLALAAPGCPAFSGRRAASAAYEVALRIYDKPQKRLVVMPE